MEPLDQRKVRMVYLITYSQIDEDLCGSREEFAEMVCRAWSDAGGKVVQWVCCKELHRDGGEHFHMAMKLDKVRRWLRVRNARQTDHGIRVNFSGAHTNYFTAWQYVTKDDQHVVTSLGHPDLTNHPPATSSASAARHDNSPRQPGPSKKRQRLSAFDVSQIVVEHNIQTRAQLLALAERQRQDGKTDLAEFVVNRGRKCVAEAIAVAWEMKNAEKTVERESLNRVELLKSFIDEPCVDGCSSEWYAMAEEILRNNNIPPEAFKMAIYDALEKGRAKYRNVLITGPANCAKTFILQPLTKIYNTFANPASNNFAWVGVESAEVIFLNDFRWTKEIIPWGNFLLLLEGQMVKFTAPKTHFAQDLVLEANTPVFATSDGPVVSIKGGAIDQRETEMMAVRWRHFVFSWQIPASQQRDLPACKTCFAKFILSAVERPSEATV